MPNDSLTDDGAVLRQTMALVPPRESGGPLRWQDRARILELYEQGWTQQNIATEMACHQSTVSRTLADLDDSRPFAQRVLRSQGVALAEQIVERMKTASLQELIKLAGKLDIVREDRDTHSGPRVEIHIGMPGSPVELPVIDATAIRHSIGAGDDAA